MAAKGYELLYFNIPGRGEVHRMVFHFLGKEFVDKTVEFSEWPALRENVAKVPCGFMPVLTTPTGDQYVQTAAILRFMGNEFGLYGKNNKEKGRIDAVLDFCKELWDTFAKIYYSTGDEAEKGKLVAAYDKNVVQALKYFEIIVKENKEGPFFVGNKPTIADIYFYETMDKVNNVLGEKKYLEKYPSLNTLREKTLDASATLRSYVKKRDEMILQQQQQQQQK